MTVLWCCDVVMLEPVAVDTGRCCTTPSDHQIIINYQHIVTSLYNHNSPIQRHYDAYLQCGEQSTEKLGEHSRQAGGV